MGFVTKQAAETLLLSKPTGTFLLRFSDSELGGVTIAYVRKQNPLENPSVFMVAPFTTRNLQQRCMADVVFDLNDLTVLFPDIPKEAFRKFSSTSAVQGGTTANGYVKHTLVTHVEGVSVMKDERSADTPYGQTSLHYMPHDDPNSASFPASGDDMMDFGDNIDIMAGIDVNQLISGIPDFVNQQPNQPHNS